MPDDTLEAPKDTVNGRVSSADADCPADTAYVRSTEPKVTYRRTVDRPLLSGTITSVVRGRLLRQSVDLSVTRPTIHTKVRDHIVRRKTIVKRPQLEVLGAAGGHLIGPQLDVGIGGGIRIPGTGSVIYQYNAFMRGHQVIFTRPLLSL